MDQDMIFYRFLWYLINSDFNMNFPLSHKIFEKP